jgi:hypothetical protein
MGNALLTGGGLEEGVFAVLCREGVSFAEGRIDGVRGMAELAR